MTISVFDLDKIVIEPINDESSNEEEKPVIEEKKEQPVEANPEEKIEIVIEETPLEAEPVNEEIVKPSFWRQGYREESDHHSCGREFGIGYIFNMYIVSDSGSETG